MFGKLIRQFRKLYLRPVPQVFISTESKEGYFSQHGQDVFLNRFLDREWGVFVDVGAHDGIRLSNSYFFEQKGWSGLCVEANPRVFEQLSRNRKCDLANVAVGTKSGPVEFADISGYGELLSGVLASYPAAHRRRIRKELQEMGGVLDVIEVPMAPLSQLLQRVGIQHADFLSMDIEGGELDALRSIDFNAFSAKVLLVENNYNSGKVSRYLRKFGYRRVLRVGTTDDVFLGPGLIGP